MKLSRNKFEDLLQDGMTRVFRWEISHGYTWARRTEERTPFEIALYNFMEKFMQLKERGAREADAPVVAVPLAVILLAMVGEPIVVVAIPVAVRVIHPYR